MPIDGVSSQNLGFQQVNPAEVAVQAEASSKADAQKKIKETSKSDKTKPDSEDQDRDLEGRDSGEDNFDEEEALDKTSKFLQKNKKFKVTFNAATEMVEMVDIITGNVIETVSPDDLMNLIQTSSKFSGFFVDRKI